MNYSSSDFGPDFSWGVASSSYQTEGAWNEDGKGPSIWDEFTSRTKSRVFQNQNGNVASNFYHKYIQDLILMQYLNIKNFRFSISWSRLLPFGKGRPNENGLDFYDRLIDYSLELGITPWITLYHWDLPQALEQKGGWTNRDIIGWFENYISLCINRYGDRVQNWMILNEPLAFTGAGYFLGIHAPGRRGLGSFLPAMHHAALCQAEGGRTIKSINSQLNVGTTFSSSHITPADLSRDSIEAAQKVDVLLNRLFIEPLLGLGYPIKDLNSLQQVEKYMVEGDEKRLQFNMDFLGVQNYTREVVKYSPLMPFISARTIKPSKRGMPHTAMDWEIYPAGIYKILRRFSSYRNCPPLIVTENGAAFEDQVTDGKVLDFNRIAFFQKYIEQVLRAKREGINVKGYFAWSFTDNFEWAEGYNPRFGLVHIDYATQKRTIKASGFWYRKFLQNTPLAELSQKAM